MNQLEHLIKALEINRDNVGHRDLTNSLLISIVDRANYSYKSKEEKEAIQEFNGSPIMPNNNNCRLCCNSYYKEEGHTDDICNRCLDLQMKYPDKTESELAEYAKGMDIDRDNRREEATTSVRMEIMDMSKPNIQSFFNRETVIELCKRAYFEGRSTIEATSEDELDTDAEEWINANIK